MTNNSSPATKQAYEVARHIIGHLEGNCGLSFLDVKQDDWDAITRLVATLQPCSAEIKRPIQGWEVEVRLNGTTALTIGHNHLSGMENINEFADEVENCARHLLSFIGRYGDAAKSPGGRDAFIGVTASLAAAISLLERTPKAKKGAPSDTMFEMMLADYRKALDAARTELGSSDPAQREKEPQSLHGMIAAIYGELDAEDCAWIDREWARMRGYILPTDGTSTISSTQSESTK